VRGENDAGVACGGRLHEVAQEATAGERVEAGDRLVEDEQAGPLGDGDGQSELGALASGELASFLLRVELELVDSCLRKLRIPVAVHLGAELEVVGHRQVCVGGGVLGDVADPRQLRGACGGRFAEYLDATGGWREHPAGNLQQGGLARAVRPDQADDVPWRDLQGAVGQRLTSAVFLTQRVGLQYGAHFSSSTLSRNVVWNVGSMPRLGQARSMGQALAAHPLHRLLRSRWSAVPQLLHHSRA
jgi:hypothetical protein